MANHGGRRPNSGRKRKSDEVALIQNMDATLAPIEAWQALAKKVQQGDTQAIKTWLAYRYGQPKQSVDLTSNDESLKTLSVIYVKPDESK